MILPFRRVFRVLALAAMALPLAGSQIGTAAPAAATALSTISLPDGSRHVLQTPSDMRVSVYATGLPNARFMALGPSGDVFVGSWYAGTVTVLINRQGGNRATQVVPLLSGLTVPHSVAFRNSQLYVAEEGEVTRWAYNPSTARATGEQVLIPSLPTGGRHVTRTISIGSDGSIYVSVGSSCNECADSANRAVIMKYRADGSGGQIYASGLRNAVGLAWQPGTKNLWAVDNGQDSLGDNIPPDEVDLIKAGANYGWPYCWGNKQVDPGLASVAGYCAKTTSPVVSLQAHSAPLGMTFYAGSRLPARYRGGIFVAYHGSMYRSQATGYKVVFIPMTGTHAGVPQDVVTGWLPAGGGNLWGRPVGLLVAADGSLLISDDDAGVVYRLATAGR